MRREQIFSTSVRNKCAVGKISVRNSFSKRNVVSISLYWKSCRFETCIEILTFSTDKKIMYVESAMKV